MNEMGKKNQLRSNDLRNLFRQLLQYQGLSLTIQLINILSLFHNNIKRDKRRKKKKG